MIDLHIENPTLSNYVHHFEESCILSCSNIPERSHRTVQVEEQSEEEGDVSEQRLIEVNCLLNRGTLLQDYLTATLSLTG